MEMDRQREILKWMLWQIKRAEARKKQLDERLMRINAQRDAPIGAINYDPLPRGANSGEGNGAASILFKLSDIEERIYDQKAEIEKAIVRVMDIMDYLPVASLEREICELRHIDMKSWPDIEAEIPMSKRQCIEHYNKALEILLSFPRIQKLISDNADAYLAYIVEQGTRDEKRRRAKIRAAAQATEWDSKNQSGDSTPKNNSGNKNRKNKPGKSRRK